MRSWTKTALIVAGTLLATSAVSSAAEWTIVDLGALPGANFTYGLAVNSAGMAVGSSGSPSITTAVQFANGAAVDLGKLAGFQSYVAYDINDHGVIVGESRSSGVPGTQNAFVYANGVMSSLGTLGGDRSTAMAINNSGTIVGRSTDAQGSTKAFVYENGVMSPITHGTAMDVNNHGLVVGSYVGQGDLSFRYSNGSLQVIPGGTAWAVNDNGLMVGQSVIGEKAEATYYANGSWHAIGSYGGSESIAYGVNNRDQIVGLADLPSGGSRAFLFSNGVMHKLDDLIGPNSGWDRLGDALDINDQGQIVGSGLKDNQWRAFIMTPTMNTFDLEVTYANPQAGLGDGEGPPAEVTARFVLKGIAGMTGTFRLEDIVSAHVEYADGVLTALDLASFQMTLGPGGVDDILTLSYGFDTILTPSGMELTLRNNSFQLYVDGELPDSGGSFSYFYPDSTQTLSLVPEPSSIALAFLASVGILIARRRRSQR